jgi:hypothetical protein
VAAGQLGSLMANLGLKRRSEEIHKQNKQKRRMEPNRGWDRFVLDKKVCERDGERPYNCL